MLSFAFYVPRFFMELLCLIVIHVVYLLCWADTYAPHQREAFTFQYSKSLLEPTE
jgi:hypothetical protein